MITSLRMGGAERLVVDLLPRFKDMGHEVGLLLFDGTRTPYYEELLKKDIKIHSIGNGFKDMHNPFLVFKLKSYFSQHKHDIIHTHNTPCQLLTACVAGQEKLITTEHNTTNSRRAWGWYKSVDRWMYSKYNHIISVSQETEYSLKKQLGNNRLLDRISTIPNGIDLDKFILAKPNQELKEKYKGKHIIMMVAAFRRQKDQQTLIKAMSKLPNDYVLLFVGDGECRKESENLAKELNILNKVNFMGFRSDIPQLMATADVFVMSSHYEGFCLAAVEGMASGKPIVASNVKALDKIVGDAGILFPHEDYNCLSKIIRSLCEDKELYEKVAKNCKQNSMQYDIDSMAKKYEQIYKNII